MTVRSEIAEKLLNGFHLSALFPIYQIVLAL
jgi:hypothetical protein